MATHTEEELIGIYDVELFHWTGLVSWTYFTELLELDLLHKCCTSCSVLIILLYCNYIARCSYAVLPFGL